MKTAYKTPSLVVALALFVLLCAATAFAQKSVAIHCGVERWAVKTGTDGDVTKIDLSHPKKVTVSDLQALHNGQSFSKKELESHPADRDDPAETQVFSLEATVIAYKVEAGAHGDSDYHIVLQDDSCAGGKTNCTVVAEIPNPPCVARSSHEGANRKYVRQHIQSARTAFNNFVAKDKPTSLDITKKFRVTSRKVRVVGVGFFDFDHKQRGHAPNVVELHPVLSITFL
jgi:hypothetical protein